MKKWKINLPIAQRIKKLQLPLQHQNASNGQKNEIVLVNLLTSNSFSPLQDPPEIPTRKETQDKPEGTNSQHSPNSNATNNSSSSTNNSNEVNFLCHCNGTFLDMGQMFSSNQEVKYIKLH